MRVVPSAVVDAGAGEIWRRTAGLVSFMALFALVLAFAAKPATGQQKLAQNNFQEMADLELVLAVDISRSMDHGELELQRKGYAAAFRSDEVIQAITGGGFGRIVVTYMEWAGVGLTRTIVDWTLIDSAESSRAFATALERSEPIRMSRTSISEALRTSGELFGKSAWRGLRRVVDVSGDGPNNQGAMVTEERDKLVSQGIVINGLPLMVRPSTFGFGIENLDEYYMDCVIGGTGSFMIAVYDWDEFPMAVRRKLLLEIAGVPARPLLHRVASQETGRPAVDCLIGEKLWKQRMRDLEWE